jgi:hypothetical protein
MVNTGKQKGPGSGENALAGSASWPEAAIKYVILYS